ncbi:hypothetical protein [Ahniella affigens]|uniref:hypothetical protein n=1 Tax=Ahniella affigens TaxID=2021234 RepID=UPI0011B2368B|nr:hypothetical protein [Ahniella affigens]
MCSNTRGKIIGFGTFVSPRLATHHIGIHRPCQRHSGRGQDREQRCIVEIIEDHRDAAAENTELLCVPIQTSDEAVLLGILSSNITQGIVFMFIPAKQAV